MLWGLMILVIALLIIITEGIWSLIEEHKEELKEDQQIKEMFKKKGSDK